MLTLLRRRMFQRAFHCSNCLGCPYSTLGFVELGGRERDGPILPHRCFCTASTSLSPLPLKNSGLSIVPPIRKGNCNLPPTRVAPDSRAMVLVKKPSLVVISANPR